MPQFIGDRIRQARALRWKSSKDLAAAMGWSAPKLTRAEQADLVEVSDVEAESLQRLLSFTLDFFTTLPDPPLCEQDLLFRAPKRTTKREKTYLAEFARLISLFADRLDSKHRLPPVRLPRIGDEQAGEVEPIAVRAREALQVEADRPIGHLTHHLERAGVVVVVRPNGLSPEDENRFDDAGGNRKSEVHYGYSTWVGAFRDRPLIVMRASASWERTRWTIAHELGHLLMHQQVLPRNAEEQASRFAGELLAPAHAIATELTQPVTLATLVAVKHKWGISLGALLPHLSHSGLISHERFVALRTQLYTRTNSVTGRTWGFDEPGWDDRQAERPRMLSAWTERCFGSSNPNAVALAVPEIPTDLLGEMLREQRSGKNSPSTNSTRVRSIASASVHSLEERRRSV